MATQQLELWDVLAKRQHRRCAAAPFDHQRKPGEAYRRLERPRRRAVGAFKQFIYFLMYLKLIVEDFLTKNHFFLCYLLIVFIY
jgi:hypothetical protein